ncbi:hypothetical protein K443DRAFT_574269 [Laccaria amethystina LaAM-08-1]|uniref:Uncharacterized protein n=1 Tax=Laccaria amethystina LaAM-08-1 TaxID=1095629 RepID=A0A0C9X865_9AGAR|nr:hypothetical protein K443DRAFT_574269 [Laccaria amethystina LaAM-08-1]
MRVSTRFRSRWYRKVHNTSIKDERIFVPCEAASSPYRLANELAVALQMNPGSITDQCRLAQSSCILVLEGFSDSLGPPRVPLQCRAHDQRNNRNSSSRCHYHIAQIKAASWSRVVRSSAPTTASRCGFRDRIQAAVVQEEDNCREEERRLSSAVVPQI